MDSVIARCGQTSEPNKPTARTELSHGTPKFVFTRFYMLT